MTVPTLTCGQALHEEPVIVDHALRVGLVCADHCVASIGCTGRPVTSTQVGGPSSQAWTRGTARFEDLVARIGVHQGSRCARSGRQGRSRIIPKRLDSEILTTPRISAGTLSMNDSFMTNMNETGSHVASCPMMKITPRTDAVPEMLPPRLPDHS